MTMNNKIIACSLSALFVCIFISGCTRTSPPQNVLAEETAGQDIVQHALPVESVAVASAGQIAASQTAKDNMLRYRSVIVSSSQWADHRQKENVARMIDRITECGFNMISIGSYRFAPMHFVDYSQTKYPEAVEYTVQTVHQNVATLRANMQLAKSKGIEFIVLRSNSHHVPANFWKAHQETLNPDGIFTRLLETGHQNEDYHNAMRPNRRGATVPHQQWGNPVFREFFLYSTERMLEVLPEVDGFINAYAEAAWTYDVEKMSQPDWRNWKDCVDYDKTDDHFVDYCNALYDLLQQTRGVGKVFGMRDWYVSDEVMRRLSMPKEELIIALKYGGYDMPVTDNPPWGQDLQNEGFSIMLDMHGFDAEHPHPIYWYDNEVYATILDNVRKGRFAGVNYQDFMAERFDSGNPIRMLSQNTYASAMLGHSFTDEDALQFLEPYYGSGSRDLLTSLKAVADAQGSYIKLLPAWFWHGDGLTPGGPGANRFWMLHDHPDAVGRMDFIRRNAVGVPEYMEAFLSGEQGYASKQREWSRQNRITPPQIIERMRANIDIAIQSALAAERAKPDAPYIQDIVGGMVLHKVLAERQIAFLNTAMALKKSGFRLHMKEESGEATKVRDTGVDLSDEVIAYLTELITCDKLLEPLMAKYTPRRHQRRGHGNYAYEMRVARRTGKTLVEPELDLERLRTLEQLAESNR